MVRKHASLTKDEEINDAAWVAARGTRHLRPCDRLLANIFAGAGVGAAKVRNINHAFMSIGLPHAFVSRWSEMADVVTSISRRKSVAMAF